MQLSSKTLEKLREFINEDTEYRSGPKIIEFFSEFDYRDTYKQGFPSRWIYTDFRLSQINGTSKLEKCIKHLFNPINYIENLSRLDDLIKDFNKYLQFDRYTIKRVNTEIRVLPTSAINIDDDINTKNENIENNFLKHEFKFDYSSLNLIPTLMPIIEGRMTEIEKAFNAQAYLSVVLLAGSTLEGIFLNIASLNPKAFNTTSCSPKKDGKVRSFDQWTLNNFIEVAHSINLIEKDTYRFSKELRDFRNYIHPFQQMNENFSPREQTAKICLQVLKSAIVDIQTNQRKMQNQS